MYPNDSEGNPFQEKLVPLAVSAPALLHSMAALAAGHLSRSQGQHGLIAAKHYSLALHELNATLSDPIIACSDSTLGACLLLCVYEVFFLFWSSKADKGGTDYDQISQSRNCLWLEHLQGARDLILFRGGPKISDYLTRFFSLLDVSGSLCSGGGPLLQGNYWLDNDPVTDSTGYHSPGGIVKWPYYDFDAVNSPFVPRRSLCQNH